MGDKPTKVFRIGSIKASIWVQYSENGHPYSVTKLVRTYKDKKTDEWKETNSFSGDDLPKIELAVNKAFEFTHTEMLFKESAGKDSFQDKVGKSREIAQTEK